MHYAYLFETRGIQRFLFATGRLRDVLAGSELIDHICAPGGLLDAALSALGLEPAVPRRAGASFYLAFTGKDDAERFMAAWRLAFPQWVPGVEAVDTLAEGASVRDAIRKGIDQLRIQRNILAADLPRPGPLAARSPRTGAAAVATAQGEHHDAATARTRAFKRPEGSTPLEQRFLATPDLDWPRNFEESSPRSERFPLDTNRLVGMLHADGNGIGQVLRVIDQATRNASDTVYVDAYRGFSDGLSRATTQAARLASEEVLLPNAVDGVLPARPIVLGGDDLTILIRSDLALDYAKAFLRAFEQETGDVMSALRQTLADSGLADDAVSLPDHLSASAGLCHAKSSYPFYSSHVIAENLCKRAKQAAGAAGQGRGPAPSMIAFHKMEGASAEDADTLFNQFHRVEVDGETFQLSLPAYALGHPEGLPSIDDLEALVAVFTDGHGTLNDRPLRRLASLWRLDLDTAMQSYERWRQLARRGQPERLAGFDDALEKLLGKVRGELPATRGSSSLSPLSDLLTWLAISPGSRQAAARP